MGRREVPEDDRSGSRLLADFGRKAQRTGQGIRAFYGAICSGTSDAEAAITRWLELQSKLHGQAWPGPRVRLDAPAARYGLPAEGLRPEALLLAMERWYVLVVRLLTGHMLAAVRNRPSPA
ncbi:MAG: hypothetical protein ABR915_22160, partial [Thermoguttaceae bacterium]